MHMVYIGRACYGRVENLGTVGSQNRKCSSFAELTIDDSGPLLLFICSQRAALIKWRSHNNTRTTC